jgi:MerR family mercuric resistance operon transcriptional regulator/MerR family gold-responsive transcriptional activator of gol and ges genes
MEVDRETREERHRVNGLQDLRIGDLADRTGVTVETLRYYEQRQLLRPSKRLPSGYRVYDEDAVALVRFIKRGQALGFTLTEVEELVRLREQAWSGDATLLLRDAIVAKVRDVNHRMGELRALRDELDALIAACDDACAPNAAANARREACDEVAQSIASQKPISGLDCPLVEALDATGDDPIQIESSSNERPRKPRFISSADAGPARSDNGFDPATKRQSNTRRTR